MFWPKPQSRLRRIILHIGPPKSGSTSIQGALRVSQEQLEEQGIHFFRASWEPTYALTTQLTKNPRKIPVLRQKFASDEEAFNWSEDHWRQLIQLAHSGLYECVVISSEHFFNLSDLNSLHARLSGLAERIDVVAYVRDPVSWYVSRTDQFIRGGLKSKNLQTPSKYSYRFKRLTHRFEQVFGGSSILVRNFDRKNLRDGDVVSDFFGVISDFMGGSVVPARHYERNVRMPGAATAWFLQENDRLTAPDGKFPAPQMALRRQIIAEVRKNEGLGKLPSLKMNCDNLTEVLHYNARKSISWLNDTYLRDQVPLPLVVERNHPVPEEAMQKMTQDWIESYRTSETDLVMQDLRRHAEKSLAENAALTKDKKSRSEGRK